jgi:hypothetical protein
MDRWTVQDVQQWLLSKSFAESMVRSFADNGVDGPLLKVLDDDMLIELVSDRSSHCTCSPPLSLCLSHAAARLCPLRLRIGPWLSCFLVCQCHRASPDALARD